VAQGFIEDVPEQVTPVLLVSMEGRRFQLMSSFTIHVRYIKHGRRKVSTGNGGRSSGLWEGSVSCTCFQVFAWCMLESLGCKRKFYLVWGGRTQLRFHLCTWRSAMVP